MAASRVIQPVTRELMDAEGTHGPALQVAMFRSGHAPPADAVAAFADRARIEFRAVAHA